MPKEKEPWFFSFMDNQPHFSGPNKFPGVIYRIEDYVKLYESASEHQLCGDASPSYLYTYNISIRNFQSIYKNPDQYNRLRFIISLRNPADRAWSQYWTFQRRHEDPLDFKDAVKQETIRERFEKNWVLFYDYLGFGSYYDQVKAYMDEFGNKRVKIILFDDLKRDAKVVCRDIFSFLGVDPSYSPNTDMVYNPSGKPKSEWLIKLILSPSLIKGAFKKVVPWRVRQQIKHLIAQRIMTKTSMPQDVREELIKYYEPGINRLQEFIDRDLGHWLTQ